VTTLPQSAYTHSVDVPPTTPRAASLALLLGGRSAKPYRCMSGATTFNSDLFRAEHLKIEDDVSSRHLRTRKQFGAQIIMMTASETQSCHGKKSSGPQSYPVPARYGHDERRARKPIDAAPLDDSLEDKVILCKAAKHTMPMPARMPPGTGDGLLQPSLGELDWSP